MPVSKKGVGMTRAIHVRTLLLIATGISTGGLARAQTVAIPAGEASPVVPSGKPDNGGQVSGLSGSDATPTASAKGAAGGEGDIVVTGSRIVANGYTQPTPVTVVSSTELLKKAPESLAAGLAQLPQFFQSAGANVTSSQAGTPSAGNYLNLRRLGVIETLLLLDGQRLPPTSFDGTTDANIIPQALVQRVDVVTGGASAAYGSDAVAGVVNFILDKKFNGVKTAGQLGISTRGDDHEERYSIAVGRTLMEDRLHLEASFDYFYQPGIANNGERPFGGNFTGGYVNVGANAARPCPAGVCADNAFTPTFNVRLANGTYGTLINLGRNAAGKTVPFSLDNYTFEPTLVGGPVSANGVHLADLGTPTGTPNFNVGGADAAVTFGTTLTSKLRTKQSFARADYDFGGGIEGFIQGSYTDSDTRYVTVAAGTQFQSFQIFSDNAFLPTFVRNAMIAQGVDRFVGSRVEADQTPKVAYTNNQAFSILTGLHGNLLNFKWQLGYSHGESILNTRHTGNFQQQRWFAALDAVRAPDGSIVCRTALTNPGLYPGCVPWNLFGNGAPSAASYAYFQQDSTFRVKNQQDDVAASFTGALFDLPAGPVNVAFGGEFRRQKLLETSNNDPSKPIDLTGLRTNANPYNLTFNSTNVGKANGAQSIEEGFIEIAVPILRDKPFFKSFDLNAAARYVNYSVSGDIWAWKGGASWTPFEGLRFRGTYSQDIRAPTLYELFAGVSSTRGTFNDIHTGVNTNTITLTQGNSNLTFEQARTLTVGAIWQPSFIPRFSASLDYYHIKIRDQITRLATDDLNQRCEASGGTDVLCAFINRPLPFSDRSAANFPINISQLPFNQAALVTYGFDYELNYRLMLGSDRIDFRLLGNFTPTLTTQSGPKSIVIENAAVASTGVPEHKVTLAADFNHGPFNIGIDVRYIGEMFYTLQPTVFVANNRIAPVTYLNANVSYDIRRGDYPVTVFLTGTNLTDKFVFAPQNNAQPTEFYPTFQSQYDVVGRYVVGGVRARF